VILRKITELFFDRMQMISDSEKDMAAVLARLDKVLSVNVGGLSTNDTKAGDAKVGDVKVSHLKVEH
jgi:hypothetical protein